MPIFCQPMLRHSPTAGSAGSSALLSRHYPDPGERGRRAADGLASRGVATGNGKLHELQLPVRQPLAQAITDLARPRHETHKTREAAHFSTVPAAHEHPGATRITRVLSVRWPGPAAERNGSPVAQLTSDHPAESIPGRHIRPRIFLRRVISNGNLAYLLIGGQRLPREHRPHLRVRQVVVDGRLQNRVGRAK